jgi:hypothetical protein
MVVTPIAVRLARAISHLFISDIPCMSNENGSSDNIRSSEANFLPLSMFRSSDGHYIHDLVPDANPPPATKRL